jgi:hypothetical protein
MLTGIVLYLVSPEGVASCGAACRRPFSRSSCVRAISELMIPWMITAKNPTASTGSSIPATSDLSSAAILARSMLDAAYKGNATWMAET